MRKAKTDVDRLQAFLAPNGIHADNGRTATPARKGDFVAAGDAHDMVLVLGDQIGRAPAACAPRVPHPRKKQWLSGSGRAFLEELGDFLVSTLRSSGTMVASDCGGRWPETLFFR
jgi:hypothetical protein